MIVFKVLFSYKEPGIEEALLEEGMRHQWCIFNGKRDFSYILYPDGPKKVEELPLREKFVSIPAFQVNRKRLKKLSSEDIPWIKTLTENTQKGFQEMIELLDSKDIPDLAYTSRIYLKTSLPSLSWWFKEMWKELWEQYMSLTLKFQLTNIQLSWREC